MLVDVVATVAVLAAVLGAAELAFRAAVPRLSRNSRILARAPKRAARIAAEHARPTVLILGNSMGREAIDARQLTAQLGIDALIEHQPADASVPREWYYELKNDYIAKGAVPRWLVLPVGDGRPLVRTKEPTADLLYSFMSLGDLPAFFDRSDIEQFDERAAAVLANASALYAYRGRIQARILSGLIPSYPDLREAARQWRRPDRERPAPGTTRWIALIDELADAHGIEVIVVAVPTRDLAGELPRSDRALCRRMGWRVLEPAAGVPFGPDDHPDGLHLTSAARRRFTALLAPALAAELRPAAPIASQ